MFIVDLQRQGVGVLCQCQRVLGVLARPRGGSDAAAVPCPQLEADRQHYYSGQQVLPHQPVTYVRVTMSPDGGISRLRLHGRRAFDRFQTWTQGIEAVTQGLH